MGQMIAVSCACSFASSLVAIPPAAKKKEKEKDKDKEKGGKKDKRPQRGTPRDGPKKETFTQRVMRNRNEIGAKTKKILSPPTKRKRKREKEKRKKKKGCPGGEERAAERSREGRGSGFKVGLNQTPVG